MPTTVLAIDLVSERTLDRPKSPSLRMPRFVTKIFADFRSRCKIFLSWACLRARQIYVNQFKTTSSEKYFLSSRCALIFENRSPSSQCSITMQSLPFFVLYTSRNRVMFGWFNTSNTFASFKVSFLYSEFILLMSIYLITAKLLLL